jgi:hypothetical protein
MNAGNLDVAAKSSRFEAFASEEVWICSFKN